MSTESQNCIDAEIVDNSDNVDSFTASVDAEVVGSSTESYVVEEALTIELEAYQWTMCSDAFVITQGGSAPSWFNNYIADVELDLTDNQSIIDLNKAILDLDEEYTNEIIILKDADSQTNVHIEYLKVGNSTQGALISQLDTAKITAEKSQAIADTAVGAIFGGENDAEAWYTARSAAVASNQKSMAIRLEQVTASLDGVTASVTEIKEATVELVDNNPPFDPTECRCYWYNDPADARYWDTVGDTPSDDPLDPNYDSDYDPDWDPNDPKFTDELSPEYPPCDSDSNGNKPYVVESKAKYDLILDSDGQYATGIYALNETTGGVSQDHIWMGTTDFAVMNPLLGDYDEAQYVPLEPGDIGYDPADPSKSKYNDNYRPEKFPLRFTYNVNQDNDPSNFSSNLSILGDIMARDIGNETAAKLTAGGLRFFKFVPPSGDTDAEGVIQTKYLSQIALSRVPIKNGVEWRIPVYFSEAPLCIAFTSDLITFNGTGSGYEKLTQRVRVDLTDVYENTYPGASPGTWIVRPTIMLIGDGFPGDISSSSSSYSYEPGGDSQHRTETSTTLTMHEAGKNVYFSETSYAYTSATSCWEKDRGEFDFTLSLYNVWDQNHPGTWSWRTIDTASFSHTVQKDIKWNGSCTGGDSKSNNKLFNYSIDYLPLGAAFKVTCRYGTPSNGNEPKLKLSFGELTATYNSINFEELDDNGKVRILAIENTSVGDELNVGDDVGTSTL